LYWCNELSQLESRACSHASHSGCFIILWDRLGGHPLGFAKRFLQELHWLLSFMPSITLNHTWVGLPILQN
jgi:hypothetical protein